MEPVSLHHQLWWMPLVGIPFFLFWFFFVETSMGRRRMAVGQDILVRIRTQCGLVVA